MFSTTTTTAAKDIEIASPPEDSSTCVRFSPVAEWIACSAFDGKTRVWEVQQNGQTIPKCMVSHDAPALGVDWTAVSIQILSKGILFR